MPSLTSALHALICTVRFATLEMKLSALVGARERRYRPDQPRAPKGTPEGGQWIDDLLQLLDAQAEPQHIRVAGPRCDGFSSGCQNGGSVGTTDAVHISGKRYCIDCAVKVLGLQGLPFDEVAETFGGFDSIWRKKGTNVIKSAGPEGGEGWGRDLWRGGRWPTETSPGLRS